MRNTDQRVCRGAISLADVSGTQVTTAGDVKAGRKWVLVLAVVVAAIFALTLVSGCSSSESSSSSSETKTSEPEVDYSSLAIGQTFDDDGLIVRVDSVQLGLENYDGSDICCVTVTYTNSSDSEESYNALTDWKVQDADGAQNSYSYYASGENELHSGSLAPGGTVSGNIYFKGSPVKILYYSNALKDSSAAWIV